MTDPAHAPLSITPGEIHRSIQRTVVGQDEALREISVVVVKYLVGHPAGNMLLIGNSGSGKTTLMKAIEQYLRSRPELADFSNVIRINANVLAEEHEGYGRAVLTRLYRNAKERLGEKASIEEVLRRIERGIVFVDEIDKIRAQVGGAPNVKGIVAQEALLTLMENEHIEFLVPGSDRVASVNSSGILFIVGGAFEELYDDVYHRATIGTESAPLKPTVVVSQTGEVREELAFHLRDYIRYEDLFRYGMHPQFVSRFESIVVLNDLVEKDLAQIFIEPEHSIFRTSRDYFSRFNVDLQITRAAVQTIAWEASKQKRLGARALKEIYRRVIRNHEFDPWGGTPIAPGEPKRVVTITEEMVHQALGGKTQGTSRPR
ncbi:MAG: AAA family ATPase [Thermoanaerobaculia bacterium]